MLRHRLFRRFAPALALPFLLLCAVFFVMARPTAANIAGNLADYFVGYGTTSSSALDDPTYLSKVEYVHQRVRFVELEPSYRSIDWEVIDNILTKASGKKVLLGIQLKIWWQGGGCAFYNGGAAGARTSPGCVDGTPDWILQSEYDPVFHDGQPMINYDNANVKTELAWLIDQVTDRYNGTADLIYVVHPGVDGENAPEKDTAEDAYEAKWGTGARTTWVNYMKWLADQWQAQAPNEERLYLMSLHFIDPGERNDIIPYVLDLDPDWGFYSMDIEIGDGFAVYRTPHTWGEFSEGNYAEEEDAHRNVCRFRPCYAEHAGNIGSEIDTEWNQYYRVWSALWQRLDGYGTLRTWTNFSWFDSIVNLFETYAGKTGGTADTAWVILREDYAPGASADFKARNYYNFLDQINTTAPSGTTCDGQTVADWYFPQSGAFWTAISGKPAQEDKFSKYVRRIDNCAYFDLDPHNEGFWTQDEAVEVSVVYLDYYDGNGGVISDTLSLEYHNGSGIVTAWTETKTEPSSGTWVTKTVTLNDFRASGGVYGYDFRIKANGDGEEYVHKVTVRKISGVPTATPTFTGTPPTPTNTPTPGPTPTPTPTAVDWVLASKPNSSPRILDVYDTREDVLANGWTTAGFSWYSEPLSTTNRGRLARFPDVAIIEGRGANAWLYDPGAYALEHGREGMWAVFGTGSSGTALGPDTNNDVNAVAGGEGLVCFGMTGSSSHGVVCADFPRDTFYRWDTGGYYTTTYNIQQRNNVNFAWTLADAGDNIRSDFVNDLDIQSVDGDTLIAVASAAGITLINVTDGATKHYYVSGQANCCVAMAADGTMYWQGAGNNYANNVRVTYDAWNDAGGEFAYDYEYRSFRTIPSIAYGTFSLDTAELRVESGLSPTGDNVIFVADGVGVTVIYENQADETKGSVRYITNKVASEELIGDMRGYWPFDDSSNRLNSFGDFMYDSSSAGGDKKFHLSAIGGSPTYPDGVRSNSITFDGSISLVYTPTAWLEYDDSNRSNGITFDRSGATKHVAQEITAPNDDDIAEIWINLTRTGSPGGNVCVSIETNSSGLPSGTRLGDQSTCIPISAIPTSGYANIGLQWLGTKTKPNPSTSAIYHLIVETDAGYTYSAGTDFIAIGIDDTSPTASGEFERYNGTSWSNDTGKDLIYYIYDYSEAFIVDNASGTDGFSVSAWISTTTTAAADIIVGRGEWASNGWQIYVGSGSVALGGVGGGTLSASTPITDGRWHHVVGVYGVGTNASHIYIDGSVVATGTLTVSPSAALFRVGVGENNDDTLARFYQGWLDELTVVQHTLTVTDVHRIYHQGARAKSSDATQTLHPDVAEVEGLAYIPGLNQIIASSDTGGAVSWFDLNYDTLIDYMDDSTNEVDYWGNQLNSSADLYGQVASRGSQWAFGYQQNTSPAYLSWMGGTWPPPAATATPFPVSDSQTLTYTSGVDGYSGNIDAHTRQYSATTTFGLNYNLAFRSNGDAKDLDAMFFRWDSLNLPSDAEIVHAWLYLYLYQSNNTNSGTVHAHVVKRDWVEGEITFNEYSSGNSWQTAGARGSNDIHLTPVATAAWNPTPNATKAIDLKNAVATQVAGGTVYGIKLNFDNTTVREYFFRSRHNVDADLRPKLVVEYQITHPTSTPVPTYTPTATPTPTGTVPTPTPTGTLSPTPTPTFTPNPVLFLNEIVYDPQLDNDGFPGVDKWDECIEMVSGYDTVQDISDWQLVTVIDSNRYTYTMPSGTVIFPGPKAFPRLDTSLPLTRTATTRTAELYNAAGALVDSRNFSNVAGNSDKRIPDITGTWQNTAWDNCGNWNNAPTPTPTYTPTATATP